MVRDCVDRELADWKSVESNNLGRCRGRIRGEYIDWIEIDMSGIDRVGVGWGDIDLIGIDARGLFDWKGIDLIDVDICSHFDVSCL